MMILIKVRYDLLNVATRQYSPEFRTVSCIYAILWRKGGVRLRVFSFKGGYTGLIYWFTGIPSKTHREVLKKIG